MLEKLKEIMLENNYKLCRRIEHLEIEYFSLTQLLLNRGIITEEDYELYLSEETISKLLDKVNKELNDNGEA